MTKWRPSKNLRVICFHSSGYFCENLPVITYHKLVCLKQQQFSSHSSWAQSPKSKVFAGLVSPGSSEGASVLCPIPIFYQQLFMVAGNFGIPSPEVYNSNLCLHLHMAFPVSLLCLKSHSLFSCKGSTIVFRAYPQSRMILPQDS